MKNKIKIICLFLLLLSLTACGKEKNYNYNRLNVKTVMNNEYLTEEFSEQFSTVYFKSKDKSNSFEYIIKEDNREEYSLDSAKEYITSLKDILKQGYQISKKEEVSAKKRNDQFICTCEYSALDSDNNIYTVKTKYVFDTKTNEAIMIVMFVDDKEPKEIKNAFFEVFDEAVIKRDEE